MKNTKRLLINTLTLAAKGGRLGIGGFIVYAPRR